MIFNLFKSKPILKELVPKNFVDIHSHILPGIDDGAKNINESLKLIYEMKEIGFSKIIATPHTYFGVHNNTNQTIINSFQGLLPMVKDKVEICYSSEYMIDEYLQKKIDEKTLLPLNKNYVLIEMSYIGEPINLYEIIFKLIHNGYKPIIAHPERYRFMHRDFKKYYKLKELGCHFQLNMLSITGYYGPDVLKISEKLLKNNLIDFVGSDIHKERHVKEFYNKIKLKNFDKFIKSINLTKEIFGD